MLKIKIVYLSGGRWRLDAPDGSKSETADYSQRIVWELAPGYIYVAQTAYYDVEKVWLIAKEVEFETLDCSI